MLGLLLNVAEVLAAINSPSSGFENQFNSDSDSIGTLRRARRNGEPKNELNQVDLGSSSLGNENSFFGIGTQPTSIGEYTLFGHPETYLHTEESLQYPIEPPITRHDSINGKSTETVKKAVKFRPRGPENMFIPNEKELLNAAIPSENENSFFGIGTQPLSLGEYTLFGHPLTHFPKEETLPPPIETLKTDSSKVSDPTSSEASGYSALNTPDYFEKLKGLRKISRMLSREGKHVHGKDFVIDPPLTFETSKQIQFIQPSAYGRSNLTVVVDVLGLLVACQNIVRPFDIYDELMFESYSSGKYVLCKIRPGTFEFLEHVNRRFQLVMMCASSSFTVSRIFDTVIELWNNHATANHWPHADRTLLSRVYDNSGDKGWEQAGKDLRILRRKSYKRVIVVDNQGILNAEN